MSCPNSSLLMNLEILVTAIYALPTIVLYIYLITTILRQPIFRHSFFYQFIILSVSHSLRLQNICLWTTIFFIQRVVPHPGMCPLLFPYFLEASLLLKPILLGYHGCITVQIVTIIVMCINRVTVILWPLQATQFWRRNYVHVNVVILLSSLMISTYLVGWKVSITYGFGGNVLEVQFLQGWPYIGLTVMGTIESLTCLCVIFFTTATGLITLSRSTVTKTRIVEANLFWTSLGFSVTTAIVSIYMITVSVSRDHFPEVFLLAREFRGWIFDANCLIPPWLLLATNKKIRNLLWKRKTAIVTFLPQASRLS